MKNKNLNLWSDCSKLSIKIYFQKCDRGPLQKHHELDEGFQNCKQIYVKIMYKSYELFVNDSVYSHSSGLVTCVKKF